MEKPRCRICGAKHYGNEPHTFPADSGGDTPKRRSPEMVKVSKETRVTRKPQEAVSDPKGPHGDRVSEPKAGKRDRWREEDPERYRVYMREYMRKKRRGDA